MRRFSIRKLRYILIAHIVVLEVLKRIGRGSMTTTLYFKNHREFNKHMKHNFLWDNVNTRYVVLNHNKVFKK